MLNEKCVEFLLSNYPVFCSVFVLWCCTINEVSPAAPASGTITNATAKVAHDVLYMNGYRELLGNIMMLIPIALLLRKTLPTIRAQSIPLICLFTIISIEFVQIYIPGSASDVRDVATNSFGAAVAVGLHCKVIHNRH